MVITNSGLTLKAKVNHFMASNDKLTTIYSESSSWMKGKEQEHWEDGASQTRLGG